MFRRTGLLLLAAVVAMAVGPAEVAAASAASAGQGGIAQVACGDTITVDTMLHTDLVDCPNNGIVIGADNITLDLNGHTIDGNGVPSDCPSDMMCDLGVDNLAGHDGVAIIDGTIRQFGVAVFATGVADNRLRDLTISDNSDIGIILRESVAAVIDKNLFSNTGTNAVVLLDSQNALVSRNSTSGSHGYAILLSAVDHSSVRDNRIDGDRHGLGVFAGSAGNAVERNAVSHTAGAIDIGDGAAGNRVDYNRLTDNGDGIGSTEGHDNVFSRNLVRGSGIGFSDTGGFGIILDGSDRNILRQNTVTGGRGPAIFVAVLDAPTAAEGNVIALNYVSSKFSDGILVGEGTTGTVIEGNFAVGNGDDGIHVDVPAAMLTRNMANHNHDLGVEAVAGVTDGGGNRAAGNGNPAQCLNVDC
jgi:parallel beta-helix repeat protein